RTAGERWIRGAEAVVDAHDGEAAVLKGIERAILVDVAAAGVLVAAPRALIDVGVGSAEDDALAFEELRRGPGAEAEHGDSQTDDQSDYAHCIPMSEVRVKESRKEGKSKAWISRPGVRRRSPCRHSAARPAERASLRREPWSPTA